MEKPRALQRDSESEALFGEFAANVPEILWMREVGSERILYVSPAWEAVTGHPRPQHRNEFLGIVHPEDAARVRQEADEAPQGGVGASVSATTAIRANWRCPSESALNIATRSAQIVSP